MKHWTKVSFAFALAIGWLAHYFQIFTVLGEPDARAASAIFAQISATMLGFLIAALSILASISGHRLLRNMQKTGHYRVLLKGFFVNSTAYAVAMLASFVPLIFKPLFPFAPLVSLVTFTFATVLLVDIGRKLWLVLHNLTPD